MQTQDNATVYLAIARNLREFGYPGISANMIREVHEAMRVGAELPHGVIGMFASNQLRDAGLAKREGVSEGDSAVDAGQEVE